MDLVLGLGVTGIGRSAKPQLLAPSAFGDRSAERSRRSLSGTAQPEGSSRRVGVHSVTLLPHHPISPSSSAEPTALAKDVKP